MSIIFSTVIRTILNLKLTCPKCRRDQIVPQRRKAVVKCRFCGAVIPASINYK